MSDKKISKNPGYDEHFAGIDKDEMILNLGASAIRGNIDSLDRLDNLMKEFGIQGGIHIPGKVHREIGGRKGSNKI